MTGCTDEPGDDRDEVERRFQEIVAGLEPPVLGPTPAAPEPGPEPVETPTARVSHLGAGTPEGMATDHRSYEAPEEDDHFVPPPPDPLPAGDLHFWAALVGLVLGPALVLLSAVIPLLPRTWTGVGAVLMVAGFVLLVLRQPRYRRDDGDWGARV